MAEHNGSAWIGGKFKLMKSECSNRPCLKKNKDLMMGTAVVLTNNSLDHPDAKTAHGLIRGTERFDIKGIIDSACAGRDAGEILDGVHRDIPVYADIESCILAMGKKPDYAIIGVALCGGRLNREWQELTLSVVEQGISIVNGMHMLLGDIPVFQAAALKHNVSIIDIRRHKPYDQLHFWSGRIFEIATPRIAVLGTDCALGKRTTARMIVEACTKAGIHAEMIYTGQTGWLQGSPYGFILDTTINDFVSGEVEASIVQCHEEANPELIVVEGQSGMRNPSGPCGAEIIVSGNVKGVVLQHAPFREYFDTLETVGCCLPELESEIRLIESYGTTVIALTLNGTGGNREDLEAYAAAVRDKTGIPVICPLLEPVENLIPTLKTFIRTHDRMPDTITIRKQ